MNTALKDQLIRERLEGTHRPDPGMGRVDRDRELPLSWGQRQFWALHVAAPESTEYLVPLMFRLRGALSVPALANAWTRLVARHEILRTTYTWDRGRPRQVIHEPGAVDFAVSEESSATDREARSAEIFERETAIPIDLRLHAPLRVIVIRYADDDHVLLAVFHHIACDAMTHGIVVRELSELYAAASEGRPDRLPPVSMQYADYAAWEQSQTFVLDYWRRHLADLVPLELPTDRPRPAERDARGTTVPVTVSQDVSRRIRELAAAHGATPYVVLLTAFQALLARYAGTTDVAVGTAVSGRNRPELTDMVGYAFNTLVMRARWDGGSFGELLAANRDRVLDAFDHAEAPFPAVADEVRSAEDQRLFQVMLDLRTGSEPSLALPGVTARLLPTGKGVARFDLTLHMRAAEGTISGELEYATALFDEATAIRIAEHYALFLDRATALPDTPVMLIDFLTGRERKFLIGVPKPAADFQFRLTGTPGKVAVVAGDVKVTFAELEARANQYAHYLQDLGTRPESIVGVRMRRTPEMVACLLGVWKTGAAYVPVDVSYPEDRVAYMLENSGVAILVGEDTSVDALPTTPVAYAPDPDSLAYVMYTSGSTGRPKGVAVTHRGLANYLSWTVSHYAGAEGGAPYFSSIAFDLGVPNLFAPLLAGQSVCLIPDDFDPAELGALLMAGAPYGFVKLTPGHLELLTQQLTPREAQSFAGLVIAAGDEFPRRLVRRWAELGGPPLAAEYGPTEITVGNSAQFDVDESTTELVPIGSPIPGTSMYVLDENMLPAPVGVVGEVYIGGVGLARGYVRQPAATAERFLPNPYGEPGSRLYRTGDLARVLPDGSVDFAGRVDQQVKLRGYRIELDEIEAVLAAGSGVRDVVVVLRDDRLVAYVVGNADPERLRRRATGALPPYMVPSAFVTLDMIPLTANGKIDRQALPAPEREALTNTGYVAPSGPVQELIAGLWSRVLKVANPSAHDSFFDLGGDSISAVGLAGALREAGFPLEVRDVFAAHTIARLAELAGNVGAPGPEDNTVAPFALLDAADRASLGPDVADAYPISLTQRGMLLEMLAGGDQNHYHNITAFRIVDPVPFSLAAFRAAANMIVARHEVMRTAYDLTSFSVPLQLVRPYAQMSVGFTDLRHLDADRCHEELLAHCEAERAVLFDLENPPLMRMHVHVCDDESWWLSITECHLIIEGWSYHSQLMEMLLAYQRIRDGLAPEEPVPVKARYADFIATEIKALDSPQDQEYWKRVLTDNSKFTVPAAWGDPAGGAERYQLTIPLRDIEEPLRGLAAAADTPYKSVLHAAHMYVLSRLTPEGSVHSGVVCDARPELPGFDRVSGMYLNSVPFPHPRGARTWRALVRQAFDSEIEMWPHRHYPMPAMPRLVGDERPVDVLFHYLDFHQVDTTLVDVDACIDDSPNEFSLVVGTPIKGNLSIASTPAVLSRDNAARLARFYRAVLEAMAADPDGDPLSFALPGSPRLSGAHREAGDLGYLWANGEPDAVAVIADGRTYTFRELARRATRVAYHLHEAGVKAETTVGVLLDRGIDLVAALAGILQAGAAYVPADPAHPTARLRDALGGTALVLTSAKHADRVPDLAPVLVERLPEAPLVVSPPTDPDSLAYVIHTSGSAGSPNAVAVPRRALANYVAWAVENYAGGTGGAPVFSSIAFDITVPNLFAPLLAGQPVCLLPQDLELADLGSELLRNAPYSFVMLTPSHLSLLLDQLGDEAVAGLAEVFVSAGEALGTHLAQRLPGLRVEYGPTETTVGVCGQRVDGTVTAPLGTPIPNALVQILDTELLPVPTGVVGELCVAGTGIARGYAGAPGRTAERFVPDPYGTPGSRLYRTGDLARMTPDGRLEFAGRIDDQAKVRGHRVEPAEIEAALLADPRVERAAVQARDGALVAYVVTSADTDDIRSTLAHTLPKYMVPSSFVVLPDLPLTGNGKRDRRALPAPPRPTVGRGRTPASDTERAIAEVWSRLLGTPTPGTGDTLSDLGADSLMILQVLAEAVRAGLELPRDLLRANATLEHIAAATRQVPC